MTCTPNRESQCTVPLKHKSPWDAAHLGSQRSQCKIMQISMGRCAPAIIYFVQCSVFFIAVKFGSILWTLHLCSHCFKLFLMILLKNTMGRKFHHNYSQSETTNHRVQGRMQLMQSKQTDSHDWHAPSRRISASPCSHA